MVLNRVALLAVAVSIAVLLGASVAILYGQRASRTPDATGNPNLNGSSSGRSFHDDYIVTGNAFQYLPNGYYAQRVNLTQLKNGDIINVGGVSFTFEVPQTEITSGGATTMIDYICSSFFHALFSNGSEVTLDYCTPMSQANRTSYVTTTITTAGSIGTELSSTNIPWSMWELSRNTVPRVGIHIEGVGNDVTLVELIVAR